MPTRSRRSGPSRKHHWGRWILAGIAALVVLVVAAVGIFIKLQSAPPPLALPTAVSSPAGPLGGTWDVTTGSVAGFRIQESFLGISNDVVGRTNAVTGTIVVSGGLVAKAAFRVDLTAIKVNGKPQPQLAKSLDTQAHPDATFTLARPVMLSTAFAAGSIITTTVTGHLAMAGASHMVTFTIRGRRDGRALQAAGTIPVAFSGWGISRPKGYGVFGSLASDGVAEFLLILHRAPVTAP